MASAAAPQQLDSRIAAGPPPKKRRRRTAGGGATDDCFTCHKRAVKCDRKRPYCTQCIEIGKECSGYKTQLTWGVGVASRGKLRGLACPIANKNVDGTDAASPDEVRSRRRKSSLASVKREDVVETSWAGTSARPNVNGLPSQGPPASLPPPTLPIPIPQQHHSWHVGGFQDHMQARHVQSDPAHGSFNLPPLHRIQTGLGSRYDTGGVPNSGMSVNSYAETEFHSPMEYPQTPGSLPFLERITSNPYADHPMAGTPADGYSMSSSSTGSYADSVDSAQSAGFVDSGAMSSSQSGLDPLDSMLFDGNDMSFTNYDPYNMQGQDSSEDKSTNEENTLALFDSRFSNPFFHLTPRLQSLMEYYDRYVCPFLVAFDGPQNPYRKHILQLAVHNEGLQNAVAALATNNLRMRKKQPPRQIGYVEELTDAFDNADLRTAGGAGAKDTTAEESMYKQLSIDQLNLQLTGARAAQDDSVLATLLILCLFHVCDSGFSKFKTQLAGVQKLLSLRNPASVQSDFTGWVEMFFTWFDVMTSTVNDREMQIKGESLDMLDFSANLGALEQFSGCDGRLFKLIARLGRLNLLAQGRPVRSHSGDLERTPKLSAFKRPTTFARTRSGRKKHPTTKILANRSLSPLDYENIDGNGWGTPILSSDEDADGSADESTTAPRGHVQGDERKAFWEEWNDVRSRLQAWQMDTSALHTPPPGAAVNPNVSSDPAQLDAGHRDMVHINETFRFSALLYTERLANPLLPSSSQEFQGLVSQALFHITALSVTSCVNKFLLWPLFITGTECVDEGHRNIIRTRCIEIQKESGFFNNLSGLEVLERVWREVGSNVKGSEEAEVRARRRDSEASSNGGDFGSGMSGGSGRRYGQAFRWRKAMDRVDGEYIVI